MIAAPITPGMISYVVAHMRPACQRDVFACRENEDRGALAEELSSLIKLHRGYFGIGTDRGEVVAIIGVGIQAPWRGEMTFLATDSFPRLAVPFHRWWFKTYIPHVMATFQRVEMTGALPDSPSGQWLTWAGFQSEGIARAYGKNGEDLGRWAWIRPAVDAAARSLGSSRAGGLPHVQPV